MSRYQNAGRNRNAKIPNRFKSGRVQVFRNDRNKSEFHSQRK